MTKRPPVLRYQPNFPGKATHLADRDGRAMCGLVGVALTTATANTDCRRCFRSLRRRLRFGELASAPQGRRRR